MERRKAAADESSSPEVFFKGTSMSAAASSPKVSTQSPVACAEKENVGNVADLSPGVLSPSMTKKRPKPLEMLAAQNVLQGSSPASGDSPSGWVFRDRPAAITEGKGEAKTRPRESILALDDMEELSPLCPGMSGMLFATKPSAQKPRAGVLDRLQECADDAVEEQPTKISPDPAGQGAVVLAPQTPVEQRVHAPSETTTCREQEGGGKKKGQTRKDSILWFDEMSAQKGSRLCDVPLTELEAASPLPLLQEEADPKWAAGAENPAVETRSGSGDGDGAPAQQGAVELTEGPQEAAASRPAATRAGVPKPASSMLKMPSKSVASNWGLSGMFGLSAMFANASAASAPPALAEATAAENAGECSEAADGAAESEDESCAENAACTQGAAGAYELPTFCDECGISLTSHTCSECGHEHGSGEAAAMETAGAAGPPTLEFPMMQVADTMAVFAVARDKDLRAAQRSDITRLLKECLLTQAQHDDAIDKLRRIGQELDRQASAGGQEEALAAASSETAAAAAPTSGSGAQAAQPRRASAPRTQRPASPAPPPRSAADSNAPCKPARAASPAMRPRRDSVPRERAGGSPAPARPLDAAARRSFSSARASSEGKGRMSRGASPRSFGSVRASSDMLDASKGDGSEGKGRKSRGASPARRGRVSSPAAAPGTAADVSAAELHTAVKALVTGEGSARAGASGGVSGTGPTPQSSRTSSPRGSSVRRPASPRGGLLERLTAPTAASATRAALKSKDAPAAHMAGGGLRGLRGGADTPAKSIKTPLRAPARAQPEPVHTPKPVMAPLEEDAGAVAGTTHQQMTGQGSTQQQVGDVTGETQVEGQCKSANMSKGVLGIDLHEAFS